MKKIISLFLTAITLFFQTGLCFAGDLDLYSIQNVKLKDVQREVEYYYNYKGYSMITEDNTRGIYYFEPKHMGGYLPKYILILKQDGNDVVMYSSAPIGSLRTTQLIARHLKSKGMNPIFYTNEELSTAFSKFAKDYQIEADKKVAMFGKGIKIEPLSTNKKEVKQKLKDDIDYTKLVSIGVIQQPFNSNLKKKYEGYVFTIKNNSKDEVKVTGIDFYNNFDERQAFKSVERIMTPGAATMYVLGGTLAIFTFGISLALVPVGLGMVSNENMPVQNELKQFMSNSNNSEVIEPNDNTNIKVIGYKKPAASRMPYIKVKLINTRTGREFEVDNRPEVLKEY